MVWIVDKKTGKRVFETDKASVIAALNKKNYEAEKEETFSELYGGDVKPTRKKKSPAPH